MMEPGQFESERLAEEQDLGTIKVKDIEIKGEKIEKVKKKFKQAQIDFERFRKYGIRVIENGACSGCKHTIETFLLKAEARDQLALVKDCDFILGQNAKPPVDPKDRQFNFGSCTKAIDCSRSVYIPGCPPHVDIVKEILKRKAGHYW